MTSDLEIQIIRYYPPPVSRLSLLPASVVFWGISMRTQYSKYPHDESPDINEQTRLAIEAQIYIILGDHDRIIKAAMGVAFVSNMQ
jgi:hypothetical protein